MFEISVEDFLDSRIGKANRGKVQLIFTSPPFPLNVKKKYGNKTGEEYREWFGSLAEKFISLLKPNGSIVIEIGNAWEPQKPTMSPLTFRALLDFLEKGDLNLCQQFICYNPARLPSPAQWVNIERIRVKDSFTHLWWMSPNERPKADNRKVLRPYKESMNKLLETGKYNGGRRPSGHVIGEKSFNRNNGGSIPPNVLEIANTASNDPYRKYCRDNDIDAHPAPMQSKLVEFFINLLTDEGDLVYDPFAGSNMTGSVADSLKRKWISTEINSEYIAGSQGRFDKLTVNA